MAPSLPNPSSSDSLSFSDLPLADSRCSNVSCRAFAEGLNATEGSTSLLSQLEYGKWTIYYYGSWIVIFVAIHCVVLVNDFLVRSHWRRRKAASPGWQHKAVALCRWIIYRRVPGRTAKALGLPPLGVTMLLAVSTIYIAVLPFPEAPYLRPLFRFGSPPLSVRCAMIILALTPLTVALAGKVNVITLLTGICYSKLNVFHRYVAYVLFALSTVHTIPHLYAPVMDGGWKNLNQLYADQERELSGTVLYAIVFGLTFLSIPYIRKRVYEAFVYTHVLLAVGYLAVLYWHIRGEYMSPNYLYATVVIFGIAALIRATVRTRSFRPSRKLKGFPTRLTPLPGNMTRVTLNVPAELTWGPGQHYYLRVPQISWLGNHPFTVANLPQPPECRSERETEMVFLIRAQKGFTQSLSRHIDRSSLLPIDSPGSSCSLQRRTRLALAPANLPSAASQTYARSSCSLDPFYHDVERDLEKPTYHTPSVLRNEPSITTMLEGPYGSRVRPLHLLYDTVILVAGGSGVTAMMPWMLGLHRKMREAGDACTLRRVKLVWMIRDVSWVRWVEKELDEVLQGDGSSKRLGVDIFLTGTSRPPVLLDRTDSEEGNEYSSSTKNVTLPVRPASALTTTSSPSTDSATRTSAYPSSSTPSISHSHPYIRLEYGRPPIRRIIPRIIDETDGGGSGSGASRVAILCCGPHDLQVELANTAARLQRRVWEGSLVELVLHSEVFGW